MANLITEIFDKQAVIDNLNQLADLIDSTLDGIVKNAPKLQSPTQYLEVSKSIIEVEKQGAEVTKMKKQALTDLDKAYQQADKAIQQSINLEDAEYQAQTKLSAQYKEKAKEQKQLLELERIRQQTMAKANELLAKEAQTEGELRMQQQQLIKAQQSLRVTNAEENKVREQLIQKINANKEALRQMSDEVSKQRDNVGNYKSVWDAFTQGQIQLRPAMKLVRDEMGALERILASGNKLTAEQAKRYQELNIAMGNLAKVQGDISARAKVLSDDYRQMTFAMEGVKLGVNIMTSLQATTALLGNENEELAKTMAKIVAIQQVMNTLSQIQQALNKDNSIMQNLQIIATRDLTNATMGQVTATKLAGVAYKALNGIMKAGLGVVGIFAGAIGGAVKMIKDLFTNTEKAREEEEKHKEILKETTDQAYLYREEMKRLVTELEDYKKALNDIAEAYTTAGAKADIFNKQSTEQLAMNALLREYNGYLEEYTALALKISRFPGQYEGREEDEARLGILYGLVHDLGEEINAVGRNVGGTMSDSEKKMSRFQKTMGYVSEIVGKVNDKASKFAENNKKNTDTQNKEAQKLKVNLEDVNTLQKKLFDEWEKRRQKQKAFNEILKEATDSIAKWHAEEEDVEPIEKVTKSVEKATMTLEDYKKTIEEIVSSVSEIFGTITSRQEEELQKETEAQESAYQRQKALIDATISDEEEKNRKLAELESERLDNVAKQQQKEAQLKRRKAVFDQAITSANAIAKMIEATSELASSNAFSLPTFITAVATGVSAVGTIVALLKLIANVPAYALGGLAEANKPFIAGEAGREIGFGVRSGKVYDFSQPMIYQAPEPVQVKNATETRQIINNNNKDVTLHNAVVVKVIDNKRIEKYFKM